MSCTNLCYVGSYFGGTPDELEPTPTRPHNVERRAEQAETHKLESKCPGVIGTGTLEQTADVYLQGHDMLLQ